IDEKYLKKQLTEFADRIKDGERGGTEEAYFVGKERAIALATLIQEHPSSSSLSSSTSSESEYTHVKVKEQCDAGLTLTRMTTTPLPPYGGIVGSMLRYLTSLEQMVGPHGWI